MTRDRLYIEAIEDVYARSNKVILDSEGSGNLLYLPIDQLMKGSGAAAPNSNRSSDVQSGLEDLGGDSRPDTGRDRRVRE